MDLQMLNIRQVLIMKVKMPLYIAPLSPTMDNIYSLYLLSRTVSHNMHVSQIHWMEVSCPLRNVGQFVELSLHMWGNDNGEAVSHPVNVGIPHGWTPRIYIWHYCNY